MAAIVNQIVNILILLIYLYILFFLGLFLGLCITRPTVNYTNYKTEKSYKLKGIKKYLAYLLVTFLWPITCKLKKESDS